MCIHLTSTCLMFAATRRAGRQRRETRRGTKRRDTISVVDGESGAAILLEVWMLVSCVPKGEGEAWEGKGEARMKGKGTG